MQYSADRLVLPAKRENNSIRPYLFVNPLQGKHIPTDPADAVGMCSALAEAVNAAYPDDPLYVIGFAETATGIAACAASFLHHAVYYQNTTRESNGGDCILFSEVHSHATNQLLRADGIGEALKNVRRILFIDDEVTTGNTICHLIRLIKSRFHAEGLRFSIVSVLNSMPEERLRELHQQGIDCVFLHRIPYEYGKDSILDVGFDPERHLTARGGSEPGRAGNTFFCPVNPRNLVSFQEYQAAVRAYAAEAVHSLPDRPVCPGRVLVLGTEEFMYPTFAAGEMIRQQGYAKEVRIHSTTRSPIIASGREGYPLDSRICLRSPYDPERTTFVYNLRQYDSVLVLTDAADPSPGLGDLCRALEMAGNRHVTVVRWQYAENEGTI